MPRQGHPRLSHCCRHASKRGMADNPMAPLSPRLPPPLSLHGQVRDSQQCQGTVVRATAAAIVVIKKTSRDGKQCQGTVNHAVATILIIIVALASKGQLTMPRHHHWPCHCCCHCTSKQGRDSRQCQDTIICTATTNIIFALASGGQLTVLRHHHLHHHCCHCHRAREQQTANNAEALSSTLPPPPPSYCASKSGKDSR